MIVGDHVTGREMCPLSHSVKHIVPCSSKLNLHLAP